MLLKFTVTIENVRKLTNELETIRPRFARYMYSINIVSFGNKL